MIYNIFFSLCFPILLLVSVSAYNKAVAIPSLTLGSPGDSEYTDVIIKKVGENITLVCEIRNSDRNPIYLWNQELISNNSNLEDLKTRISIEKEQIAEPYMERIKVRMEDRPLYRSRMTVTDLQESDSGLYICSSPPFSLVKKVFVQNKTSMACARGAFSCGKRCVLPPYVCDGRPDCLDGEDERHPFCPPAPCDRKGWLRCSGGRCIPREACCDPQDMLCRQPSCCEEHNFPMMLPGFDDERSTMLMESKTRNDFNEKVDFVGNVILITVMSAVLMYLLVRCCRMSVKRRYRAVPQRAGDSPRYELTAQRSAAISWAQRPAHNLDMYNWDLETENDCVCLPQFNFISRRQQNQNNRTMQLLSLGEASSLINPNLDNLVRHSNGTYTLNGRTIHLLGAEFENCPPTEIAPHPPPYTEVVQYKMFGPPPEYSADGGDNSVIPPEYGEMMSDGDRNRDNDDRNDRNRVVNDCDSGNAICEERIESSDCGIENANNENGRNDAKNDEVLVVNVN